MIWVLARAHASGKSQTLPGWGGWISVTGLGCQPHSKVDYMPPVNAPVTENATVQEILNISQDASRAVGQQYTVVTFDLAVAKKAMALVWESPAHYSDVIVRMGAFHTASSYFAAIGKSLRASGFEEVILTFLQ